MKRVTVHDVAAEAGVSLATVDRVLNGRPGVREETRQKVRDAMSRLGYERDLAAANLAKKRLYPIRFIVPEGDNAFLRGLDREILDYADKARAGRVLVDVVRVPPFDGVALADALDAVDPEETVGVAVVATQAPIVERAINAATERGIAVATLISDVPASRRMHYVGIDNRAAGRTAAGLLGRFLSGHSGRIAIVAGSMLLRDHVDRHAGFVSVIAEEYPELEPLPPIQGRDDNAITERELGRLLHETENVIGLYSLGAGNRGVIAALKASGMAGRIRTVAHELTPHSRQALVDGTFDAVLNQDPGHEVRSAIRVLQAHADGLAIVAGQERIRIDVFLRDNLP